MLLTISVGLILGLVGVLLFEAVLLQRLYVLYFEPQWRGYAEQLQKRKKSGQS